MFPNLRPAPGLLLVVALAVGAAGCGDAEDATGSAGPSPTSTPSPTGTPSVPPPSTATPNPAPTPGALPGATPGSPDGPTVGIPDGFPDTEVPLLPGLVTGKTGGTGPDGRVGWVLEMSAVGTQDSCFAQAAARLRKAGFTQQGEIVAGDTRQAQFTSPEYAVIVSVRADGDELCQASYEVGQVAG